jgi:hypothetical protein
MPNIAPTAILTTEPEELTLPVNKVLLDLSESYDLSPRGKIVSWTFAQTSGPLSATITPNGITKADVVFLEAGNYTFMGTVKDARGLTGTATVNITVHPFSSIPIVPKWGIKAHNVTSAETLSLLSALNIDHIRPPSVALVDFLGTVTRIDDLYAAGKKCIVNINYRNSTVAIPYCTDLVLYRSLIRKFLTKYAAKIELAVIENEVTTDAFYTGNIQDYINLFKVAVDECHNFNLKVTDSCLHVENIIQIANIVGTKITYTTNHPGKNVADVAAIIIACKTIPSDFMNIHTNGDGSSYPAGQIKQAADFLRAQTGKPVTCNEWHTDNATEALIQNMVAQFIEAEIVHSLYYGGGGASTADPINIGGNLTTVTGEWFRDAIA